MEVRTLTRRIELFDQTISNMCDSIERISKYLTAKNESEVNIKGVVYKHDLFEQSGVFIIILNTGYGYEIESERLIPMNILYDGEYESYQLKTDIGYKKEFNNSVKFILSFKEELKEW